jgi:hypothetical protein
MAQRRLQIGLRQWLAFHGIVRAAGPARQPPTEKCDVNARAIEPNPPRVTPSEPEADVVADAGRLDEESPLKEP